ncbi:hypothetical protein NDU88_004758 [Pleurodeles waltl]|uniref:Reverse transcriptase domain-containing protein n=1 Tax=Pleurodeles waltl TaxID=8319 RepID=A0AAV7MUT4_PLEWA|nr:hypothetical protein NDU88_004758 [Pleurodeles waltl]
MMRPGSVLLADTAVGSSTTSRFLPEDPLQAGWNSGHVAPSWIWRCALKRLRCPLSLPLRWLLERTPDSLATHKEATRKHHQLIRLAKRSHFTEHLNNNAHNSKELFCIVKELSNPSANVNDVPPSQKLCDALSTFLYQKIATIHDSLNTTPPPDPTPDNSSDADRLTTWTHVDDAETRKTMNSIHSGSPSDPCPHHVYNKADSTIAPQLRKIINLSFDIATFLDSWKHADIQALLKKPKADLNDLKNFRPISLLPFPAKVIEKIVNTQLTHYLEDNSILDPSQSGFRCNHSTETALLATTDDIRQQMDNGETSALIPLDLSAAFDTVCHRTLVTRLHEAGIQDKAFNWISSFLSGRTQRVRLSPFCSEATNLICGVPQGSSLSPTLFNVYMAALAQLALQHNLSILSYTDDTQLILSLTNDPHTAKANLHEGLKSIAEIYKWILTETRKTVTQALVSSRLDYGNALYTGIPEKDIQRLQCIQNASAGLILDISRQCHISHHLKDLHWLPVDRRITFKLLTHAHKALHNAGPAYLNNRLNFYVPSRQLRSANLSLAIVPRFQRKTSGGRSFSYLAAKTWNSLPTPQRQTQDLLTFRRLLKTWLFDQ